MFSNLTEKINQTFKKIRGEGVINEKNLESALREIRIALLEADVALDCLLYTSPSPRDNR